jgi:Na+-translocating ferredoxin:NAD+ oxidoreductase RnfD subunit
LVLAKQGTFASLPGLFWGNVLGSAGETSAAAILLGGMFLLVTRVGNWRTPVSVLGSFLLGGVVLRGLFPEHFGPVGFHLLAGGLLFGALFMATDPVTSPITNSGKWVYGCIVGLSTLLIRNLTGYVEGVMFAILLGNICAPIIDQAVFHVRFRRLALER